MNNQTNPEQLLNCYRTTLISLARHYTAMLDKAGRIRMDASHEPSPGRRAGLFCNANVMSKNAARLREVLEQDKAIMNFIFGTSNLQRIAKETIKVEE